MAHTRPPDDGAAGCGSTDEWELAARQLQAISAFHHARAIAAWAVAAGERSRGMREQDARRLDVLRRKHEAVIRRAHEQLRSSGVRPAPPLRHRAVLADPRADQALAVSLERHGMAVVARVANGADAVGIVLVEQPDVVLVSEPLDMVAADDVVRDVRRYSPGTGILAVAGTPSRARACTDAGATVVLEGEVERAELVEHLLRIVGQRPPDRPWRSASGA